MKKIKTSSLHEAQKQTLESALLFLSEKAAKKTMKMEKNGNDFVPKDSQCLTKNDV